MAINVPDPSFRPNPPPVRLQAQPGGWAWIIVAILSTSFGIALNVNLLQLVGYALLLIGLINLILATRDSKNLTATRRLIGPFFVGRPYTVEINVTSPRHRRGLDATNWGDETSLYWAVPELKPGETFRGSVRVVPTRRGKQRWAGLWVGSSSPFGLYRHSSLVVPWEEILVLPALGKLQRGRMRHVPHGPEPKRPKRGMISPFTQADVRGLRDYRPGDSPRSVHWRTSARLGRLMVREYEEPPGVGLLVVLDPTLAEDNRTEKAAFEAAVSLAATLCWSWAGDCRWLGLLVATQPPVFLGKAPDRPHVQRILEALAVVVPGPRAEAAAVEEALRGVPPVAVLLVSTVPSPLEETLRQGGRRKTVRCLDPDDPSVRLFYEPPPRPRPEPRR